MREEPMHEPSAAVVARAGFFSYVRLVAALLITAVMPLGWGRIVVVAMQTGRPETIVLGAFAAVFLTVLALTWGCGQKLSVERPWRWQRQDTLLLLVLVLIWCGSYALVFGYYVDSLIHPAIVYGLFVPSTLWVLAAAWCFYWPLSWKLRLAGIGLLLFLAVDFPLLMRVDGLTGDGKVNFAWRHTSAPANIPPEAVIPERPLPWQPPRPADFTQLLGPARSAMLPGVQVGGDWSKQPPKLLWRRPVGLGWSSCVILHDWIITQEQVGNMEAVTCLQLKDGQVVWRHVDSERFGSSLGGPGPRATPCVADGGVYTVGTTGLLNCLDFGTGKAIWSVNILTDNQGQNIDHGICGSPLVRGDLVYVCPTREGGPSLVAYHRVTGQRQWQAGKDRASYSSPMWVELCGQPQILVFHSEGVTSHDPADQGAVLWTFPWTNGYKVNCSQPLVIENGPTQADLLISTGYDKGSALIRVQPGQGKAWSVKTLWEKRHLQAKFTTAVLHRGFVFGLDNGILCCLDPKTGDRRWKGGRYNHGQVLLAGDRLIVQTEEGPLVLVEPSPERLIERGKVAALDSKTWNHPAITDRHLVVRNDLEMICFELPGEP